MSLRERFTKEEKQATESFVKSLTNARDLLDDAIDEMAKADYETSLESFNQAETQMKRARNRAQRVADTFDELPRRRE